MSAANNPFGLLAFLHWNHDWNDFHFNDRLLPKALDQLNDLGVGMIRIDILWSDLHCGDRQYDFSRYDRLVSMIRQHGIDVLALLQYNKIKSGPDGDLWNRPPDSFEEFADYVGATVSHFRNDIHNWEVWNEPNHPVYWHSPQDHLRTYARLLRLSYDAAKRADPTCRLLNGGLTEPVIADVANLYASGGQGIFDALSLHTFVNPLLPGHEERFDRMIMGVRDIMVANGDADKKIWITEMGCPGVPNTRMRTRWFEGESPTESQQAEWIEKQFALITRYPFIEKMFWAFYRDTNGMFRDDTDHFGIVRFDLTPKPAFHRLQDMIRRHRGGGKAPS